MPVSDQINAIMAIRGIPEAALFETHDAPDGTQIHVFHVEDGNTCHVTWLAERQGVVHGNMAAVAPGLGVPERDVICQAHVEEALELFGLAPAE